MDCQRPASAAAKSPTTASGSTQARAQTRALARKQAGRWPLRCPTREESAMLREPMGAPATRQTIGYFSGHVALGLMSAVLGPTLPALAAQVHADPGSLGVLFAARSLGYLLASLVGGQIYDRVRGHPILTLALVGIAVGLATVPLMPTRLALIGLFGLLGLAQGVLDVGNNMLLARVHGSKVAPYMSALHCAYGVGALLAPLIVGASASMAAGYWALALAMLPVAAVVGLTPSPGLVATPETEASTPRRPDPRLVWLLVGWFMLCQGAEAGFAGWVFTVAGKAGFDDASATRLVSSFWAAFTLGRLSSIAVAAKLRPQTLLTADLLGALASVLVLVLVPGATAMWIATLTLGLSLASLFPASMSLASQRMPLDGAVTSKLFVGASVGSMLVPWLLGYTFVLGPRGPLWVVLVDLLVAAVVLLVIRTRLRGSALRLGVVDAP